MQDEQKQPKRERTREPVRGDWRRCKLFVWSEGENKRPSFDPPAVELSYRVDQQRMLWSYTPGRMRDDGDFVPNMHLSDRDLYAYRELFDEASRVVGQLKARLRDMRGGDFQMPPSETVRVRAR